MSGYQATELVLATIAGPVAPALERVREYLQGDHRAAESDCYVIQDPQGPAGPSECYEPLEATNEAIAEAIEIGYGARLDMELRIGPYGHLAMLCIVPAGESHFSLSLKLESSVMDAIHHYDRSMVAFDEEAKRGLVKLCIGLTAAAEARGFLVLRDGTRISPITAEEIAQELRVRVRKWRIGGVVDELLSLRELQRLEETEDPEYIYSSVTGLTIYDLVHSIDD